MLTPRLLSQRGTMKANMRKYLPHAPQSLINSLYGSLTKIRTYPPGDPIREGVIRG
jgi:hypothetical protein